MCLKKFMAVTAGGGVSVTQLVSRFDLISRESKIRPGKGGGVQCTPCGIGDKCQMPFEFPLSSI